MSFVKSRFGAAIPRAIRTTVILIAFGLVAQYYFGLFSHSSSSLTFPASDISGEDVIPGVSQHSAHVAAAAAPDHSADVDVEIGEGNGLKPGAGTNEAAATTAAGADKEAPKGDGDGKLTVWQALRADPKVSRFADVVGMFDDIVGGLNTPQAKFTLYAPVNEVFEREFFPWDLPWFYWKFLAGYHMGPGLVGGAELSRMNTVGSFVNGDIFFFYKQRISTQVDEVGKVTLNHVARVISSADDSIAVNGRIHYIDEMLRLPNSTASVLRQASNLSTLREALEHAGMAESVYDTNAHVGQTLLAPTNKAFEKLGSKVNHFLFSPWGRPYLQALLKGHIVGNRTVFSDVTFPHDGAAQMIDVRTMITAAQDGTAEIDLPTLNAGLNITARFRQKTPADRITLSILPSSSSSSQSSFNGASISDAQQHVEKSDEEVPIFLPDHVTMDGVVHEIDTLLVPMLLRGAMGAGDGGSEGLPVRRRRRRSFVEKLGSWLAGAAGEDVLTVEGIMERLGPYVVQP